MPDAVSNLKAIKRSPSPMEKAVVSAVTDTTVTLTIGDTDLPEVECLDSYWPREVGDNVWVLITSPASWLVLGSVTPPVPSEEV